MKHTKTLLIIILALVIVYLFVKPGENTSVDLGKLEKYYEKTRTEWEVPGIAVGIVKDNELVLAKGFGVKDITSDDKVDKNTNFAIASNSKAFTALGIVMLEKEGKLSLDDKVKTHLPWFQLYDPYVSDNMTIRDLLCHRSGHVTFSGDLLWHASDHSPEEIVKRAKHLKAKYGFRESYGYSNIMYLAAGLILENASGQTWDEFMQQRFFTPLEMNRTISSITDLDKHGNFVQPHIDKDEEVIKVSYVNWDNAKALGGIISNVVDVSEWLKLQLNNGVHNADSIFTKEMQDKTWQVHTARSVSEDSKKYWPSTHFKGYGLGWGLFDYLGKKVIMHTGGYEGTITATILVPEENLGIVILTNKISSVYSPIMYRTLDAYLGGAEQDWSHILLQRSKEYAEKAKEKKELKYDPENIQPSLNLENYAGKYSGQVYGGLDISLANEELYIRFDHTKVFHSPLTHLSGNLFELEFKDAPSLPKGTVEFIQGDTGNIVELIVDIPNPDFDFTELDFIKQ